MTTPLATARPPQSLKKPRPLRSVSVQENATQSIGEGLDVNHTYKTQLSAGDNGGSSNIQTTTERVVTICPQIAAMSASILSDAASDESRFADKEISSNSYPNRRFNRSISLKTNHPVISEDHRHSPVSVKHLTDFNSNNVYSQEEETGGVRSYDHCDRFEGYRDHKEYDCNSSNDSVKRMMKAVSSNSSQKKTTVTVLTEHGEELEVSGKNVQTILFASRILLKEMKAKIVKVEESKNDDADHMPTSRHSDELSKEEATLPLRAQDSDMESRDSQRITYSKQELLRLSKSQLSKQTPPRWNILTKFNTEICIPADGVEHYFNPKYFVEHDGSIVLEVRIGNDKELSKSRLEKDSKGR